jgi:hypothetical protein
VSLYYSTHKVFKSHLKSSQADFLYSSVLSSLLLACLLACVLLPLLLLVIALNEFCYIAAERTWTYSKHISLDRYPGSPMAGRSDQQKTQLPLLFRAGPCLQSCCLATRWSNPLQYCSEDTTRHTFRVVNQTPVSIRGRACLISCHATSYMREVRVGPLTARAPDDSEYIYGAVGGRDRAPPECGSVALPLPTGLVNNRYQCNAHNNNNNNNNKP